MPLPQICVARIGAAHGVRGAVKLWTFTEDPLAVTRYGQLMTKDGAGQFEVTHVREAKGHLVATLKGIATREEAERLNGVELYIAREKLPATGEDEYYHADLIGLAAVNAAGEPLGRVIAIHNFTAPRTPCAAPIRAMQIRAAIATRRSTYFLAAAAAAAAAVLAAAA